MSDISKFIRHSVAIVNPRWLLSTINQPLGLGQLELIDGHKVRCYLYESAGTETAKDISYTGSLRGCLSKSNSTL